MVSLLRHDCVMHYGFDPLTRLAPAGECAGCEPRIMKGRP